MTRMLLLVVALAVIAAPAASAKDGAQAHLLRPLPAHPAAGTMITIRWTVTALSNGKRVPFGATGMFVKLIGANHASTTATARQKHGPPYSVRIRVPRGGIRAIRFGLHSFSDNGPGDWYFPLR